MKITTIARATLLTACVLSANAYPRHAAGEQGKPTEAQMPDFKLADDLTFAYGQTLAGVVRGGEEHGLELQRGVDGRPVTRAASLNLEHYFSTSKRAGLFVPRKGTRRIEKLDDRTVRITIGEQAGWKVTAQITYTFAPGGVLRADYAMTFGEDYRDFNTLLSVYHLEEALPYLHINGEWRQVELASAREHRFWCRSAADLHRLRQALPAMNADYAALGHANLLSVDDQVWDEPVMVTRIRDTGWAVILWFDGEVRSVSANTRWKAHDFSIGGRDVKRGETLRSTVWMAYRELKDLDDALRHRPDKDQHP